MLFHSHGVLVMTRKIYKEVSQVEDLSTHIESPRPKHYLGCLFAVSAATLFPLANVFIKLGSFLNGIEHLVVFYILKLLVLMISCLIMGQNPIGDKQNRFLLAARGLFGCLAAVVSYKSIVLLPISDFAALSHSTIVMTAIFSRAFLKEKLDLSHLIALLSTVAGVICISKPTFIFADSPQEYNWERIIGTSCVLISSLFSGVANVLMKKLSDINSHWCVVAIYDSYFGVPINLALAYFLLKLDPFNTKRDLDIEMTYFVNHLLFSCVSGLISIVGQVFATLAFNYEDATKVSIFRASDVVVAFLMQVFILKVKIDYLSLIGSVAIFFGILFVLVFEQLHDKYEAKDGSKRKFSKIFFINI